jgi:hypothetical protein
MHMKKAVLALLAGALLMPAAGFAGRLDGDFATREDGAADDTNESCMEYEGHFNSVHGRVTGISGECTVQIDYFTETPHKASATALKGTKTEGSAKVSQSVNSDLDIVVTDTDGGGPGVCAEAFVGTVNSDVEKCKISGSLKGDSGPDPDTVESARNSASCDLGEAGANVDTNGGVVGIQAPSQAQIDVVVDAFADRQDVKLDNKGKLSIKHKGVADTTTPLNCI